MKNLFLVLPLIFSLSVFAATPIGKTHTKTDYSQQCDGGAKVGSKCVAYRDITLSWTHPTQNMDGSSLELVEISHYVLMLTYNSGPAKYWDISKKTSTILRNMPTGDYGFSMSTVSKGGTQGPFTNTIQITVE